MRSRLLILEVFSLAEFRSKSSNLTLYMEHVTQVRDANGNVVSSVPSRRIRFEDGRYVTADKDELDFLRRHRLHGTAFVEVTTASAPSAPPESPQMERANDPASEPGVVAMACDFPGCDYVAEDTDPAKAQRRLNSHKTAKGHHTEA